jgi:UPF0755 protein
MSRAATRALRALVVAAGVLLAAIALLAALDTAPRQPAAGRSGAGAEEGLFVVEKGESLGEIADRLAAEGYVRSPLLLRAISRFRGTQGSLKAGWYRIPAGASTRRVHDLLVSGEQSLEKVTIPEGWTSGQIARLLEQKGVCPAADFVAATRSEALRQSLGVPGTSLEGWLFPDTYFLPRPFPAEKLAGMLVEAFFEQLEAVAPDYRSLTPTELEGKVTLASIVEREYRAADEAPLIASVFYNRLARGIGLESCATIAYIITEIQGKPHPGYITLEEKSIDSPYNTYRWAGLPPGPIANPGRVALEAAFHPARTDYYYFVLRDPAEGRHYFSKDLDEHNQAKRLYLKN